MRRIIREVVHAIGSRRAVRLEEVEGVDGGGRRKRAIFFWRGVRKGAVEGVEGRRE